MYYQRIHYFLKAAEANSFSGAAAQIHISPQALTKQICLLEEELGGKLFERSSKGIELTEFGEYARPKFYKIDADLHQALDDLKGRAKLDKQQVNIGIFSGIPRDTVVFPMVSYLLGAFPHYQIVLNMTDYQEGYQLLFDGKIDLLLTNTHEEYNWTDYRCLSLNSMKAKVLISLLHPWAIKERITEEDMQKDVFLKLKTDHMNYKVPPEESFYENIPCRRVEEVSNFNTMFTLLQQGIGFAVFPGEFAYMAQSRLMSFDYPGRDFIYHTAIVYREKNPLKALAEMVRELQEEFDLTPFV